MDADHEHSVTLWLNNLRQGDETAASELWQRFFGRMERIAKSRLTSQVAASNDAEDMALSAYNIFVQSLQDGKFPELDNRDDLWRLLVTITIRKANAAMDKAQTQKRGHGADNLPLKEEHLLSEGQSPAALAMVADECRHLMGLLGDNELATVAMGKLEGLTNEEIASQLGSTKRTVQRMTALIRDLWAEEAAKIVPVP